MAQTAQHLNVRRRKLSTIIIQTVHILQYKSVDTGSLSMDDFSKHLRGLGFLNVVFSLKNNEIKTFTKLKMFVLWKDQILHAFLSRAISKFEDEKTKCHEIMVKVGFYTRLQI